MGRATGDFILGIARKHAAVEVLGSPDLVDGVTRMHFPGIALVDGFLRP